MLTGRCPFIPTETDNIDAMFAALMKSDLVIPDYISPLASDLINKLLVKVVRHIQPSRRLTNVSSIKQHAFFSSIDWKQLSKGQVKSTYRVPADLLGTDDLLVTNGRCISRDDVPALDSLKRYELYVKNYTFLGDDFNFTGRVSSQQLPMFMPEAIREEENETSMVVDDTNSSPR